MRQQLLRRVVQRTVADPMASALLDGQLLEGGSVLVDAVDGVITVTPSRVGPTAE